MGWTLIVSENDLFQREAMNAMPGEPVVGATGEETACGLVGSLDVARIVVDGSDELGRSFLAALRAAPVRVLERIEIVIVGAGDVTGRFRTEASLADVGARAA